MSIHFASQFGGLRSGILKSEKKCHHKVLALFSDLQFPTYKCSEVACNVSQHFPALHYEGQAGERGGGGHRGMMGHGYWLWGNCMLTEPGKDP
jgi:hypothetical protein